MNLITRNWVSDLVVIRKWAGKLARNPKVSLERFKEWLKSYRITLSCQSKISCLYHLDRLLILLGAEAYILALGETFPRDIYNRIYCYKPKWRYWKEIQKTNFPIQWIYIQREMGVQFPLSKLSYVQKIINLFGWPSSKLNTIIGYTPFTQHWKTLLDKRNYQFFIKLIPFQADLVKFNQQYEKADWVDLENKHLDGINKFVATCYTWSHLAEIKCYVAVYLFYKQMEYDTRSLEFVFDVQLMTGLSCRPELFKYLVNISKIAAVLSKREFNSWTVYIGK